MEYEKIYPIDELLKLEDNQTCFDCGENKASWANSHFAVYLCLECALNHKDFFEKSHSHIKAVESPHWSKAEYVAMKIGGNQSLKKFYNFYDIEIKTTDISKKYMNKATEYYVKLIKSQVEGTDFPDKRPSKEEGLIQIEIEKDLNEKMNDAFKSTAEFADKVGADISRDFKRGTAVVGEFAVDAGEKIKDGFTTFGNDVSVAFTSTFDKIGNFFKGNKDQDQPQEQEKEKEEQNHTDSNNKEKEK